MPLIVRSRKMPGNGTSGALVLRSISTKAPISATAIASSPSVVAELQPASLALTSE